MGVFKTGGPNFPAISKTMGDATSLWMNARVQIFDPNLGEMEWDEWTNTASGSPRVIWEGEARVQPIRNADIKFPDVGFAVQNVRKVRVQVPLENAREYVRPGFHVRVLDGELFPDLELLDLVVTNALNSTYAWLATIDCEVNAKV